MHENARSFQENPCSPFLQRYTNSFISIAWQSVVDLTAVSVADSKKSFFHFFPSLFPPPFSHSLPRQKIYDQKRGMEMVMEMPLFS